MGNVDLWKDYRLEPNKKIGEINTHLREIIACISDNHEFEKAVSLSV